MESGRENIQNCPQSICLKKMFLSRRRRNLTVIREEDIRPERSVSDKRTEKIREQEWYRVGFIRSFVSCIQ